jgi:hypothetical protein
MKPLLFSKYLRTLDKLITSTKADQGTYVKMNKCLPGAMYQTEPLGPIIFLELLRFTEEWSCKNFANPKSLT